VRRDTRVALTERLRRVHAIVEADFRIRFRRPSTLVAFLLLTGLAYISVPNPATGNAMLVVDDGRRALYNSGAIGMATALIVTISVGLAGFYVVSNAIAHDIRSRCGFVIASTTMRAGEYLIAKLAGNVVFLATFTAGFMISSMAMLLVRNEAGLEPWLFVSQYLLLVPPVIILVAVLAIVFESIPFLSGRAGDVIYFVVYLLCLSFPVALIARGQDPGFARYLDFGGMALTFEQLRPLMQTANLSIGGDFDPVKPLFIVPQLTLTREWVLPRLVSLVAPLLLLVVALRSFHRFDPARVTPGRERGRTTGLMRINDVLKPLLRALLSLDPFVRWTPTQPSLLRAAATDAHATFAAYPMLLVFAIVLAVATVSSQSSAFMHGVLPLAFLAVGLAIADMACRERRAGTLGLIQSAPLLKAHFVWWKLAGSTLVAFTLLLVPFIRVAVSHPTSLGAAAVGLFLVAAMATSLGVISVTPKAFTVVFLTMLYIVTSDRGASRELDFAGFYGVATPFVTLTYVAIALACLVAGQGVYMARLRREG
jgi:hypothetical protein